MWFCAFNHALRKTKGSTRPEQFPNFHILCQMYEKFQALLCTFHYKKWTLQSEAWQLVLRKNSWTHPWRQHALKWPPTTQNQGGPLWSVGCRTSNRVGLLSLFHPGKASPCLSTLWAPGKDSHCEGLTPPSNSKHWVVCLEKTALDMDPQSHLHFTIASSIIWQAQKAPDRGSSGEADAEFLTHERWEKEMPLFVQSHEVWGQSAMWQYITDTQNSRDCSRSQSKL